MKRGFLILALVILTAGGVFGQDIKNWISGEITLIGGGLRYERMISPKLSIGGNAYWSSLFFFWNEMSADVTARFYPMGDRTSAARGFYLGLGLGFHLHTALGDTLGDLFSDDEWWPEEYGRKGIGVTPDIGWKIDAGQKGKFFLYPGIKIPVTLGWTKMGRWNGGSYEIKNRFGLNFGVVPYFGIGYAF